MLDYNNNLVATLFEYDLKMSDKPFSDAVECLNKIQPLETKDICNLITQGTPITEKVLEKIDDINEKFEIDGKERTLLSEAVKNGDYKAVELLMDKGANIELEIEGKNIGEIIEGVKNEIASKKEELKGMDNNKNENDVVALLNEAEMSLNNIEKIENLIEDKKSEKQFEKSLAEVL